MYRVKKTNGWNKYRIQKKVWFFFWKDLDTIYESKAQAQVVMCMWLEEWLRLRGIKV